MKHTTVVRSLILVIPLIGISIGLMPTDSDGNVRLVASQAQEQPSHGQKQERMAPMTEQDKQLLDKFVKHESRFKEHYQSHFSTSNYEYHQYRPAYQHGFELGLDPRYRKMDWSRVEPEARRTWNESTMGIWNQYKDAVRYGWEQASEVEGG